MTYNSATLPAAYLGWQVVDPGPPPLSPLIDDVPNSPHPQQQSDWRRRVEADQAVLAERHSTQALWFPVMRPRQEYVVPFFGGTAATWQKALTTVTAALIRGTFSMVSAVDLSGLGVFEALHKFSAKPATDWTTEADTVSSRGSSISVLEFGDIDDLTTVVADTVAMADAQQALDAGVAKQTLLRVGRLLTPPVDVDRLADAVAMALTNTTPGGARFSKVEVDGIRKLHAEVQRRPSFQQDLDRLERNLRSLGRFARNPARTAQRYGRGPVRVRTLTVESSSSAHEFHIARQIVATFVARTFSLPARTNGPEALVLAGADGLPRHLLQGLVSSAQRHGKQLVLLFEHLDEDANRYLGAAGSKISVFFALPSRPEAERASEHLGREYKFVVNGSSYSESHSEQRSESHSVSCDQNTSKSLNFGRDFSRSITSGSSRGTSSGRDHSTGFTKTRVTETGRVHEYVIEPEQFQSLPDTTMLVVEDNRVTLADCDPSIRGRAVTATEPFQPE